MLTVSSRSWCVVTCGVDIGTSLEKMHTPGVIADREAALAVFQRLREMQARGARIMYGHDPDFWTTVPQAPVRLG